MNDHISWADRLTRWLAGLIPRRLAYAVASRFWAYAYNFVTDQQSDHFLAVVQAGYDHWDE